METLIKEKFVTILVFLMGVFTGCVIMLLTIQEERNHIDSLFILGIGTFIGLSIPRLLMKNFRPIICLICGVLSGVGFRLFIDVIN